MIAAQLLDVRYCTLHQLGTIERFEKTHLAFLGIARTEPLIFIVYRWFTMRTEPQSH